MLTYYPAAAIVLTLALLGLICRDDRPTRARRVPFAAEWAGMLRAVPRG